MNVRHQKVESQIRRIVSTVLQRDMADPRVAGLISVTHVQLTPDMHEAHIYVSVLSDRPESTVMQGLLSAQKHVQRRVAEALSMKFVPRLSFHLDSALKRQNEVLALLNEIHTSAGADSPEPAPEAPAAESRRSKSAPPTRRGTTT
jgi:ribosome-binding factor A